MPKASPGQFSFNGGEVSPLVESLIDLDKRAKAVRTMVNFIPLIQGTAMKRSGTRFVAPVKDHTHNVHLIPFRRSVASSYVLEFGDQYIRFYRDNVAIFNPTQTITGATQADPVVVTVTAHGYSNGTTVFIENVGGMTEINDQRFLIANVTANTFELQDLDGNNIDGTAFTAYTSGGTVKSLAEVTTPYLHTEVMAIQVAQSADVMYLVHPNHPPQKLSRTGDITFTFEEVVFDWVPLLDENLDDTITITASAVTGSITLTASSALFDANHVGGFWQLSELAEAEHDKWETNKSVSIGNTRIFEGNVYEATSGGTTGTRPPVHLVGTQNDGVVDWLYLHSGDGYVEITSFTSSTSVDGTVVRRLPDTTTSGTFRWSEGAWSDFQGFPRSIAFYETRLWFGGTAGSPQTLWASATNAFEDFLTGDVDDDSLRYTINTDQVNTIQWLSPDKVLAIGTEGGEFIAHGNSLDEPITPTSVRITRQTTYGSIHIRPERSGASILFIPRSGNRVREYLYNFDIDRYIATDLAVLASHITEKGVRDSAYQQEPNQVIWYAAGDGSDMFALTYNREQEVVGFHRHVIGGTDSVVESVATIPDTTSEYDELWLLVSRTINGSTRKYVEYMARDFDVNQPENTVVFSDSAVVATGTDIDTVTGLDHLEGETVEGLIDGATVKPDQVVTNGSVTFSRTGDRIVAGLPYKADLETLTVEAGAADGIAQGKTKRIHDLTIRLHRTGPGLFFGPNESKLDEIFFRTSDDLMDAAVPLFSGDKGPQVFPSRYEKPGRIFVRHQNPLPCMILGLMPQLHTQDR